MLAIIDIAFREVMLVASVGLFMGGLNDCAIDCIWILRGAWRRCFIFSRYERANAATLALPRRPGRIAIMVAAWREDAVIGDMLRAALARIAHADFRIYVGVYDNDPATIAAVDAVAAIDPRVRWVGGACGPTTKGECLNRVWRALTAIPRGETLTYSELARAIGAPTSVRAVARACATNPIALVVPCHRVIGTDGRLHGFRWGLDVKRTLIEKEKAKV